MKSLILVFSSLLVVTSCQNQIEPSRETDFNTNWLFSLDIQGDALSVELKDESWNSINLPHDWSIEFPFDSINGEGCTAYLPGGIGWYRKHFNLDMAADEKVFILFDGVYNNSEYWINGEKLGIHPYGYSPFYFDITPFIEPEGKNVIAVKVDRSRYADSRWYTGSGINRNVKLVTTKNLFIPIWGSFITTPEVSEDLAIVNIETTVANETESNQQFTIETRIISPEGKTIKKEIIEKDLASKATTLLSQQVDILTPSLWDIEDPNLYQAVTRIVQNNKVIDDYTTIVWKINAIPALIFQFN